MTKKKRRGERGAGNGAVAATHLIQQSVRGRRGACVKIRGLWRRAMRWFYGFLLVLTVWGGYVQLSLREDAPAWQTVERPR